MTRGHQEMRTKGRPSRTTVCHKEWLTRRQIDRSQLLIGVDVRGLPESDCRKSRNGMLSIAMATIAEFESRYQVNNTHQEAGIAGVEDGDCLPPSSRSPAVEANVLSVLAMCHVRKDV